jgi:alkylation response protein AidB-like acyl-CoA dehydrogenase
MDFALDDDQQLIVETVRRFADRDLRTWAADADRAGAPPDRLSSVAGDLGFFVDAVPASHDGMLDGSYSHATRALRGFELGRGCAALAALIETNVEPSLAVARWGSDAAKKELFGSLASGGLATLAHDSRGTLDIVDGRVTGKIGPVPALGKASHVLVIARGLVFLAPTSALKVSPISTSGWRAAHWGTAQLDAFKPEHVLPAESADHILAWARVSLAARAAGVATAAMEFADAYAKERVQFGQPIGKFESLIRLRDDAETGAVAAKTLALYAAWALDTNHPKAFDLASRARVLAGDVVSKATIDAVQIFGGYGFVNDYPVEKLMRDARAFDALYGDERLGRVLAQKAVL